MDHSCSLSEQPSLLYQGTYSVQRFEQDRAVPYDDSPLNTATDFSELGLSDNLYRSICRMGFSKTSRIQEAVLPLLLEDPPVNVLAQAQSGTGKTAAFLLAALTRVRAQDAWPQIIILLPTLELAEQIASECRRMLVNSPEIRVRHAIRGATVSRDERITEHILIGTPGKMLDWALRFRRFDIKKIRVFVLDEADVMLAASGHYSTVISIHRQLNLDGGCQMLLFSATFSRQVVELTDTIIAKPLVKIQMRNDQLVLSNIRHFYMETRTDDEKLQAILNLYESLSIGQCIIFCRTREGAKAVARLMVDLGQNVAELHGALEPAQRLATIEGFRTGHQKVMVTTNVTSRGIDIVQVSLVINFDLPLNKSGEVDMETYYHRTGRAGRFGRQGTAVNLVRPDDRHEVAALDTIRKVFKIDVDFVDFRQHEQIAERMQSAGGERTL